MRINLKTPFADKDRVKALGARWDATRKTWYVVDAKDLTPFMPWIPDLEAARSSGDEMLASSSKSERSKPGPSKPGVITRSKGNVASCSCAVLPWVACVHSGN